MNSLKVRPDIGTLNAILQTLTSSGGMSQTKTFALRVVAEFKELGIKPSLASYYHILNIFSRERNCRTKLNFLVLNHNVLHAGTTRSGILEEIVSELEKEGAIHLRDPADTQFFVAAMDVCSNNLIDTDLAKRIHKVIHTSNNYNLIGMPFFLYLIQPLNINASLFQATHTGRAFTIDFTSPSWSSRSHLKTS
jgi:pentatricopeptide repeat domain-containing protein 3